MEKRSVGVKIPDFPPTYIKLDQNEKFIYITSKTNCESYQIAAIITYPDKKGVSSVGLETGKPRNANNKLALLLHGSQSHKSAIYQTLLAKRLAQSGYWVLRIDFRGQGDSSNNFDAAIGRTLDQDLEDISVVYQTMLDRSVREQLYKTDTISLGVIVAHSRGCLLYTSRCV